MISNPDFDFVFHFAIGGGYPIWWGELRFRFQNLISIFKFSSCPAPPNVILVYIILCLWLCWYVIYYALHYIWYIYSTFFIGYSALIFTLFIVNIVTLYTFFHRIYVGWCTRIWYAFDIRCIKSHLVLPTSYLITFLLHLYFIHF